MSTETNLNDKVKLIIAERQMTPSYFADEIGVQRSSISHILSGRNKPSLEIIQKIVARFPELTYEWILEQNQENHNHLPTSSQLNKSVSHAALNKKRSQFEGPSNTEPPVILNKEIEKILIFFSDKTFTEYRPER